MRASVIIRSKDEAPRLKLTLASLAAQTTVPEVVVVNDGSSDETSVMLSTAACALPITRVDHATPRGRSAAANAGAEQATGDILIFLDGDTLAGPEFVARHLAIHRAGRGLVARGETFHLRQTRLLADPATGSPMPGEEARIGAMSDVEKTRMLVTEHEIKHDFSAIDSRAQPGIYPGAGPRGLYELEMDALRRYPNCPSLWVAASGANQSLAREAFAAVGGFRPEMTINEHRELALSVCQNGLRMVAAEGARSYHMTHRKGWRDPLKDGEWEEVFYRIHPLPEVALLSVFWASLSDTPSLSGAGISASARIASIPALDEAARRCDGVVGAEAVRRTHLAGGRPSRR